MIPVIDHAMLVAAITGQELISSDINRGIWLSSLVQESEEIGIVFQTGIRLVSIRMIIPRQYG